MINSDFKWLLLLFVVPWMLSLLLYRTEQSSSSHVKEVIA